MFCMASLYLLLFTDTSLSIHLRQLCALVRGDQAVDDLVQIPAQNGIQLVQSQLDPVVCHPALGEIIGADLLGTVPGPHLALPGFRLRVMLLRQLQLLESGPKHLQCLVLILKLGLLILAGDHDPCRNMGQTHRGIRRIDTLASVTGRPEHVEFTVIHIQLHIHLFRFRHDSNRDRGGVDPSSALCLRNTLYAVDAAFIF